jgi:hypothetical protein
MRAIIAALVLLAGAYITWTWVFTVPKCLSSGWGTPGYWASPKSLEDDEGAFGCWWKTVTKERVRERAFEEWARDGERLERERRARQGRWYREDN